MALNDIIWGNEYYLWLKRPTRSGGFYHYDFFRGARLGRNDMVNVWPRLYNGNGVVYTTMHLIGMRDHPAVYAKFTRDMTPFLIGMACDDIVTLVRFPPITVTNFDEARICTSHAIREHDVMISIYPA
jgi:hypothetical protein